MVHEIHQPIIHEREQQVIHEKHKPIIHESHKNIIEEERQGAQILKQEARAVVQHEVVRAPIIEREVSQKVEVIEEIPATRAST